MIRRHIFKGLLFYLFIPGIIVFLVSILFSVLCSSLIPLGIVFGYFIYIFTYFNENIYTYLSGKPLEKYVEYFNKHYQKSFDNYLKYKVKKEGIHEILVRNDFLQIKKDIYRKKIKYKPFNLLDLHLTYFSEYTLTFYVVEGNNQFPKPKESYENLNYNLLLINESDNNTLEYKIKDIMKENVFDILVVRKNDFTEVIHRNFMAKKINDLKLMKNGKKQFEAFNSDEFLLISNFQHLNFYLNKIL